MLYLLAFPFCVCLIEMHNLSISLHDKLLEFLASTRVGNVKTSEHRDILKHMCVLLPERWRHTKAFPHKA